MTRKEQILSGGRGRGSGRNRMLLLQEVKEFRDMKEKDLPIDRTKHKVYSKNAKKCVQKLLNRYYDKKTAVRLWEKVQLQYCEYLKDEPALKDLKITTSI